jgi:hypothetical protein
VRNVCLVGALLALQYTPLLAADKLTCIGEQNIGFNIAYGDPRPFIPVRVDMFTLERDAKNPRKFTERVLPNGARGLPCQSFFDISGKENIFCEDKWEYRLQVALTTNRFTFYRERDYLNGVGTGSDVHLEIGRCTVTK